MRVLTAQPSQAGVPYPRTLSVGAKLAGATIALMLVATAVVYAELSAYQQEHLLQAKQMAARAVTRLFADSCAAPIVFGDTGAINEALARLGKTDDISYAAVWSSDASGQAQQRLAELGDGEHVEVGLVPPALEVKREASRLVLLAPVRDLEDEPVGLAVVTFSLVRENAVIAQVRTNTLFASGAIAAGLTLLLLTIARFAIVRPLGKLLLAANKIERGLASDIEVSSTDEIGQLAAAFRSMAHAITIREERIVARNRDMRLVLDNVGQGFLTLDLQAQLSEERSRVVEEWFGPAQPGASFGAYLARADARAGERFEIGWMQLIDDVMPIEVSIDQLPPLIHLANRAFELVYRPIMKAGRLDQVLVVITDVSARLEHERTLVAERETMCVFKHILTDRGTFEEFYEEATAMVREIGASAGSHRERLQRVVHSLKGNAASYGLESVATLCHAIEEELRSPAGVVSDELKRELDSGWSRVSRVRAEFAVDSGITVGRDEHRALLLALQSSGPAELAARLAAWQFDPASRRLESMGRQLQALARRLGKGDVRIRVEPTELRLPAKRWAPLWMALSHVVRNTIDHGLEAPEQRVALGKSVPATVTLSLTRHERELVWSIEDDGRGIDWGAIAMRGRRLGLAVDTPEALEAALFAQGVSSRDEITTTSGRGVGLSAVHEAVRALGGRIEVHSEPGRGTRFVIYLPLSMLNDELNHPLEPKPSKRASTSPEYIGA